MLVGALALLALGLVALVLGPWAGRFAVDEAGVGPDPSPAAESFPNETTTGVPPGTVLRPSESVKVTQDGTVVEGLDITGTVVVEADDVVIRNTRIRSTGAFAIRLSGGRNLLVEDSEIDGQGGGHAAVAFNGYTLRRVNIHNVTEGPRIAGGNVTIEDSYIHHLAQQGDNHTDAIQLVSGSNILIRGNTIHAYNPDTGVYGNAAFQFGEDDGAVRDCLVEGNLMNGGNYTVNGGGSGTTGAECTFRDNRFQEDMRYGVSANIGPGSVWEISNTWYATGEPAR